MILGLCVGILIGLEVLSHIVHLIFSNTGAKLIPVKGKHLDNFSFDDLLYIWINKAHTMLFVYHLVWVCQKSATISWQLEEATVYNTVGSLVLFYIFYGSST
jgi:hypothetical protein